LAIFMMCSQRAWSRKPGNSTILAAHKLLFPGLHLISWLSLSLVPHSARLVREAHHDSIRGRTHCIRNNSGPILSWRFVPCACDEKFHGSLITLRSLCNGIHHCLGRNKDLGRMQVVTLKGPGQQALDDTTS